MHKDVTTISYMYSSGGYQTGSAAYRADNRYFNSSKNVGKQIALGNTLYSQMFWAHWILNINTSVFMREFHVYCSSYDTTLSTHM